MSSEQIAFQITYATIDSGSSDQVPDVERMLREQRVLAALKEAEDGEIVALIPVTESGAVVALDSDGRLRFDLSVERLHELFQAAGVVVDLGLDDDVTPIVVEASTSQSNDDPFVSPEPVKVAEFSRRAPWAARVTAQVLDTNVEYIEDGTWSLYRYATDRPHMAISGSRADLPIIELNRPQFGPAWVEVTARGGATAMFWPNSERTLRPVLDLDAIDIPETVELYRRMLTEADGTRDELEELGNLVVDIEAAHRACVPEALGGVAGEQERLAAFVAAFGVASALITRAFDSQPAVQNFEPRGWPALGGELIVGGTGEFTALTRRQRPVARFLRGLRRRPLLGAALSTAELTAGVALTRSRSGFGRMLGIFLVIDAIGDLVVWAVRMRRR